MARGLGHRPGSQVWAGLAKLDASQEATRPLDMWVPGHQVVECSGVVTVSQVGEFVHQQVVDDPVGEGGGPV